MIHHLRGREKALEPFGLTGCRAEWIALASLHGGVFTRMQFSAWLGVSRFTALRFVQGLRDRRLAAEETVGDLKVCRICARGIYRALGAEGVRHRRITSPEVAMRRLLSFDYVIEHTGLPWLPTEPERVAAFEALGIRRSLLPVRVYRGSAGGARRYFPRGMPVALASGRAVFVHADPGYDTSTALRSWRDRHRRLWEALRELGWSVEVVGVACAQRQLGRAEKVLGNWTSPARSLDRAKASATGRQIRREIEVVERGIRSMDESVIGRYGRIRDCLTRLAELRAALPTAPSEATIDRFTVWRSSRFSEGGTWRPWEGAVADPEVSVRHRGRCARKCRSGRTPRQFRKLLAYLRLCHSRRRVRDARALAVVAGSDPRIRHASYGTAMVGMCAAIPPLPGVAPVHQSRAGRRHRDPQMTVADGSETTACGLQPVDGARARPCVEAP